MKKQERLAQIIDIVKNKKQIKAGDIMKHFNIGRVTAYRDIQELIQQNVLTEVGKGIYNYKEDLQTKIEKPFFEREKKQYQTKFLENYIPNSTYFLTKKQRETLLASVQDVALDTDFYHTNKRLLETILIDLSFASSNLEGNTYSYLDTEVLLKYHEIAQNKEQEETQMLLNHKKAIEYIIFHKNKLKFSPQTFYDVHTLLGEKLLPKKDLGQIRTKKVEIGLSTYSPLATQSQLKIEFDHFIKKLNKIKDPFEQCFFIMVFIPYFQLFADINKRTSRMLCNLPLLKHNLPLISLLAVNKKEYISAILTIYEFNDPSLLAKIYVENYLTHMHRYT